jgi:hypothetical protein
MKKIAVLFGCLFAWCGLAGMLVFGLKALISGHAKSNAAAVAIVVLCALAFWSFYGGIKKSRAAGASSFEDHYENLAFRFCVTPLVVFGVMVAAMKVMA